MIEPDDLMYYIKNIDWGEVWRRTKFFLRGILIFILSILALPFFCVFVTLRWIFNIVADIGESH